MPTKKTRGKGEGALFKDSRGLWTVSVELPMRGDKRRRKVIRSKSKTTVLAKLREMQTELAQTGDLATGTTTVEQWLIEWFETIATQTVRPTTAGTYRSLITHHIIPAVGAIKLERLLPSDVRAMNRAIVEKGLSSTTAKQAHRILSTALKAAHREGKVARNVAELVDAPRRARTEVQALTRDEGIQVLKTAAGEPLGSLWAAVLLTGARQGELLGLQRDRVDDMLTVSWQLQRLPWEHGCGGTCGFKRGTDCHSRKVTKPPDWEHQHLTGGLWLSRPKSRKGWRIIPLVEPLRSIILRHLDDTKDDPNPHGLVWRMPDGSPISPKYEYDRWNDLLTRAHVTPVTLHAGRHTTVDLLLEAGVPVELISEIVGHSSWLTTEGYKSRGNKQRLTAAMHQLSELFTRRDDARSDTPGAIAS